MSADFIALSVYLLPMHPLERKKRMRRAIDSVPDDEWVRFLSLSGNEDIVTKKQRKEYMGELINDFIGSLEASDVLTASIGGVPGQIIFTGGVTYGEDPTSSFDALNVSEWPDEILKAGGIDQPINMLEESMNDPDMPDSLKTHIKEYLAAKRL
jgi:hypothetical protein